MTVDVETTTKEKGNPFCQDNQLVSIHIKDGDKPTQCFFQDTFTRAAYLLEKGDLWITFNGKFDINWIRSVLGIVPPSVWDVQLAEFIFSRQLSKFISLNDTAFNYKLPQKLDVVKLNYWDKGIDTTEIPREILYEYGNHDVDLTYECFLKQVNRFEQENQPQYKLFRLHCNDLLVLADIEYNGIYYDVENSLKKVKEFEQEIERIDNVIKEFTGGVPLNLNSTYHKSVLLYGGTISQDIKLPIGVFKTGARAGETKYKTHEKLYPLPRLVEPLKGSELAKEGYWGTDEPTLMSLRSNKTAKWVIKQLLDRAGLVKLNSTYLEGLPKLIDKMNWARQILHTNLNQAVVVTGRLSSTKPNVQNQPPEVKKFCTTRFA